NRCNTLLGNSAELFIIDELAGAIHSAACAIDITPQSDRPKAHRQCVEEKQATNEWLADAGEQLDCFGCLERTDDSRKHSEHSCFGTIGNRSRRRRLSEKAAVAGAVCRSENRKLSFEAMNASIDSRNAEHYCSIVYEISRWEIIRCIDDDVETSHDLERVYRRKSCIEYLDVDIRIGGKYSFTRDVDLCAANIL